MGPRREREGSEREMTRPVEEQTTPCQAEEQASRPVQLEMRLP